MENDELWAVGEVLNRIVDVTRKVPALHIGYFFLDDVPTKVRDVIQRALYMGALQHKVKLIKIEFLREPFQYLKKVFCSYAKFTKQSTILTGTFVPSFEYKGLINQAVVYPFYQDPGRAIGDLKCGLCKTALQVGSMPIEKCACEEVTYCSSACRDKHLKEHSKVCTHSSSKASAAESSKESQKKSNPFQGTGGKYNCANCHKRITSLMACASCLKTWYCSRKCQKVDWPRHKKDCTVTVAATNGGLKCHNCQKVIREERTKCTACENVSYCSISCRTSHWTKHMDDCSGSAKFVIHIGPQAEQKVQTAKKTSKKRAMKAKKPSKPSKKYNEDESDSSPETPEDIPMPKANKKVSKTDSDMPEVDLIKTVVPEAEIPKKNMPDTETPKTSVIVDESLKTNVPKADAPDISVPVTKVLEGGEPEILTHLPDTSTTNSEDDVISKQKKKLKSKIATNIRCAYCGKKPPSKPQRCARCHKVFYCGQECQKADWKDHKLNCKLSD